MPIAVSSASSIDKRLKGRAGLPPEARAKRRIGARSAGARVMCWLFYWIRNSSTLLPSAIISLIQRGVLPRPDQVSEGSFGFRNFGSTLG